MTARQKPTLILLWVSNELWLIDADNESIEVRNADIQEGRLFWQKCRYANGEIAESKVLADWKIAVSEVFAK